jgi:hypothetical protein
MPPEVSSDAMFAVAIDASTMGSVATFLQDQRGGLQPISRKPNSAERGNTYFAYDLDALAACEAVKHYRYGLEGCSMFLVVKDHGTMRHRPMQPNNTLNKRQAHFLRDLEPFLGKMTLAYRKGALNETDQLNRRSKVVPHATIPLLWDCEVPSYMLFRRKSHPLSNDAQLNSMIVNALRLSLKSVDLVREGYSQELWGRRWVYERQPD